VIDLKASPDPRGWAARFARRAVAERLPEFPWDSLTAYEELARSHPGGVVDLSVGSPVDPSPQVIRAALGTAADSAGYPTTVGSVGCRRAAVDWLARRFDVVGLGVDAVLPSIGSKELIASLPLHLGLGPGDTVVIPELAYPTYEVGARLAGCEVVASDSTLSLGPSAPAMLWLNSPANPTGRVLPVEHLRKVVSWARERGVLLASDECYLELAWDSEPASILHPDVCGGSFEGLLSVHSLSKRSNLAGYRVGFVAGDAEIVARLLAVRKNLGLMMPGPMQNAMAAGLCDDAHVEVQRARYAARRAVLRAAFEAAGFRIDHSEASIYLWATRGEPDVETVGWLAERGVLVAPGHFYGDSGAQHIRIALTVSDERAAMVRDRLSR
jgi:succinyldiaminopimelate transaminase